MRKRSALLGLLTIVGCGAGAASSKTAVQPAAAEPDEGELCLEDARSEREAAPDAPAKIDVAHILVRHAELTDPRGATRSPKMACLRALEALKELQSGQEWSEVSERYNDSKQDALGRVAQEDLTPPFAAAAFSLEVNQLSYVVETDRGFHIILRKQ